MWDWIKEAATTVANAGAQYLMHTTFIESLMTMTYEQAYQALHDKVFELDNDGYQAFLNALNMLHMQTQQQLQNTAQFGSGESWGSSFEDQMAQSMAEIQAGVSGQPNPVYQQLQSRLQNLEAIAQHAQAFRQEALAAGAGTGSGVSPAAALADSASANISAGASRVAEEVDAFQRHAREIFSSFTDNLAETRAEKKDDAAPLDEMAALQLYVQTDGRVTAAMTRLMPGSADAAVIDELLDICDDYRRVMDAPPSAHGMYSDADLNRKIGQALTFAAMAAESLRDDKQALGLLHQALDAYMAAGDTAEIAKCQEKIGALEVVLSGDTDAEIESLQSALLAQSEPSLDRAETLISLGEAINRNGDDFGAREHLHDAEDLLIALGHDNPDSGDLAQSLMASMQALMAGEAQAGDTDIEKSMAVRGLYMRLYHALGSAYRDDDPERAASYLARAEAMDSQAASQDFGAQMMALLNGGKPGPS
ncbi:MAG: hypothetical protein AAF563_25495 [Pseudomonadota bacterium]